MQLKAITDKVVSTDKISRQSLLVGYPNSSNPVSKNPTGEPPHQRNALKQTPIVTDSAALGAAISLRDYQKLAIAQVYAFFRTGIKSVLLYAPTGAGKTVLAAKMIVDAVKKGRRVLFLVHRAKLVKQTVQTLRKQGIEPSVIWAGWHSSPDYSKIVLVAMVQTLQNRELPPDIGLVIADEVHTTAFYKLYSEKVVPTYGGTILALSKCFFVGLSASPWRTKATEGYCHLFQAIVRAPYPQELIDMGYLVRSRQFGYDGLIDFKKLDTGGNGDFTLKSMESVCTPVYNSEVVKRYVEVCPERKAIVFTAGVKQALDITAQFHARGITAECIIEATPEKERDAIFERFHHGSTHILISVNVLCEGFDEPTVEAVLLARPTKSRALLVQMCGRGLRLSQGKSDCYFLDFAENFKRLGLHTKRFATPLCPRGSSQAVKEEEEIELKTCPNCGELIPAMLGVCPKCGYVFPKKAKNPPPPRPFGEILSPEQEKQAKYLRKYFYNAYWKEKKEILNCDTDFSKRFGYQIPNSWCIDAIFQGNSNLMLYHQQLYLRFLRQQCSNQDDLSTKEWIKLMMYREFGDQSNPVYRAWWEILGLSRPLKDVEQIKLIYRNQCEYYANTTYGRDMLELLSLAMCEALDRTIKPGVVVTWSNCPGYLEWMQPFKVKSIDHGMEQAELEGLRDSVPISQLLAA
ncbi:DEAD/DEAH box helicase family protein [Tolypothrix sp. LEGE 11397]|uniref:DEAD/DEAH box helicase n=1 Tax=Tolypothrix sp. LEGE 11397 TaxID=2777971 RepID=UPI0005EABACE|nr:DEAD/DEAH box helicase [Tolypothrix sp. LEGE 11397]EKE96569.1 putative helicase [Tolypothrix sp. PCC 7601]MBE9087600.1 DEAD/DEAH box helicase family protein [Tolypothrix sp. LEGE 11397]UYD30957.1 DEAD/DEAH box helicase family protein [Tolypothrix sp. PCC 7712]BAY95934.1 putative helicase [Microchaete diplosiphon NIES-3275]